MKIRRSLLKQFIREELASYLGGLLREKEGENPDTEDADAGKQDKEKDDKTALKPHQDPDNSADKPKGDKPGAPEQPAPSDEPADSDLDQQAAGEEPPDEEPEDDEADVGDEKKLSDQLVGKTIQSITANPKSKLMPGAQEITIQFDQIPEPLKILVTKTGAVKYYHKGLHNEI